LTPGREGSNQRQRYESVPPKSIGERRKGIRQGKKKVGIDFTLLLGQIRVTGGNETQSISGQGNCNSVLETRKETRSKGEEEIGKLQGFSKSLRRSN